MRFGAGFFHQAHRAVDDCHALLEVLALELPTTGTPALAVLLAQARKKTMRISPFDLKDTLKRRGHRWSDGSDGRPRSWYVDVDEIALDGEIAFLKTEIYLWGVQNRFTMTTHQYAKSLGSSDLTVINNVFMRPTSRIICPSIHTTKLRGRYQCTCRAKFFTRR
jgi:hypothetical protein